MARKLKNGIEAKKSLMSGIDQVAKAVSVTLGPKGKNVCIDRSNHNLPPLVINDGVSVAREIVLEDEFENMGASLMNEVATKTNDKIGDGTTTSIVLAQEMAKQGFKQLSAGANPILLRKGMKYATNRVLEELDKMSSPVETDRDIKWIASISSGSDSIGEMIAEAFQNISKDNGFITIEDSQTMETKLKIINGMRLKTGFLSKIMCTDKNHKVAEYMQPYILLVNREIGDVNELIPILEKVVNDRASLLIIAKDITGDALNTLVLNKAKGIIDVVAIKAPGFGRMQTDLLEDIAVYTGATLIDETVGTYLKDTTLDMLGKARSIQVQSENTIILDGYGDKELIKKRIESIEKLKTEETPEFDIERYRERISKLQGSIAVIEVGADSELEANELKLRIEDAIASTKSAIRGGMLVGGGASYIYASNNVSVNDLSGDELVGANVVMKALEKPLWQISDNAGLPSEYIVAMQKKQTYPVGFNANIGEFVDMKSAGIVDPTLVSKSALTYSVSVVSTLLTSEAVNIIMTGTEQIPTE